LIICTFIIITIIIIILAAAVAAATAAAARACRNGKFDASEELPHETSLRAL
jgi:hypothetical protein